MGTLKQDIKQGSEWLVKAFKEDKLTLDYSINSFIEIDKFFNKHVSNGKAKRGGRLSRRMGATLFSIAAYVGNTIIKNAKGSVWITDDDASDGELTISVKLPDGSTIFPAQRIMKRFKNGNEDSIYVYGYEITKDFSKQTFDESYWETIKPKPWWKFW